MICLRFRHSLHHCVIAVKMCQRVGGLEPCQTQNVSRFIFWMTSEKLYAKFGVQTEKNWWLCSAKISSAENITMMQLWAISPAEGRGSKGSSHGISKISERDLFLPCHCPPITQRRTWPYRNFTHYLLPVKLLIIQW